jgi:hypothetical protein
MTVHITAAMDAKYHCYHMGPPQQGVMYTLHVDNDVYKLFRPFYLERHGHTAWKRTDGLDLPLFRNNPEVDWVIRMVDAWINGKRQQRQADWLDDANVEKLKS